MRLAAAGKATDRGRAGCVIMRPCDRRATLCFPKARDPVLSVAWSRAGGEERAGEVALQLLRRLRRGASIEAIRAMKEVLLARSLPPKRLAVDAELPHRGCIVTRASQRSVDVCFP